MRIAVAGGTGLIGTMTVGSPRWREHDVRVLSRSRGVDLVTGAGLAGALDGVDVVVDVTNLLTFGKRESVAFFTAVTTNLLRAGQAAGVGHHLALSIVGIDRIPSGAASGYYAGKLAQEELIARGDVPWTVLRAAQFHEFPTYLVERMPRGPVLPVPRMRTATVAASEVAAELVLLAGQPPSNGMLDMAGPQVHEMPDLVRRLLRARGSRRWVVPLPAIDAASRAMARGALLPDGDAVRGTQTFDEWLASR